MSMGHTVALSTVCRGTFSEEGGKRKKAWSLKESMIIGIEQNYEDNASQPFEWHQGFRYINDEMKQTNKQKDNNADIGNMPARYKVH